MIQRGRRKQSAEYMMHEQIVLNSPTLPVAGRYGEQFSDAGLVGLVALGPAYLCPPAHTVTADPTQLLDALVFPDLAAIVSDAHRQARPFDGLFRRLHDGSHSTIVRRSIQIIARQRRR